MAIQAWHIMKEKISVGPDTTVRESMLKMISSGLAAIPVVNDSQELLGLAAEHAVLGAIRQGLDPEQLKTSFIMIKPPLTADAGTGAGDLIEAMTANSCCSVITITRNGKYAGVVSRRMLMDIYTSPHYARFAQKDRKAPFVCL